MSTMKSHIKSIILIGLLGVLILAFGGIVFTLIKDKGATDWNIGTKRFVPGESPYSTERVR